MKTWPLKLMIGVVVIDSVLKRALSGPRTLFSFYSRFPIFLFLLMANMLVAEVRATSVSQCRSETGKIVFTDHQCPAGYASVSEQEIIPEYTTFDSTIQVYDDPDTLELLEKIQRRKQQKERRWKLDGIKKKLAALEIEFLREQQYLLGIKNSIAGVNQLLRKKSVQDQLDELTAKYQQQKSELLQQRRNLVE